MITNNCLSKDGYIINQDMLRAIPYGKYTSDYNGCGWIATFNAMKLLGERQSPKKIIQYLNHYTILNGKLGTNPIGVKKYLLNQECELKCTLNMKKFDEYSKNSNVGIILYLNNKYCHYVAFNKCKDKYRFFNDIYGKEEDIRTMEEFLQDNKIKIAYLYTINR